MDPLDNAKRPETRLINFCSSIAFSALVAFVAAAIIAGLVRRHTLRHSVIDIPNERSSHTEPMPRGGGLAICTVFLAVITVLGVIGWLPLRSVMAFAVGGLLVSIIGWTDDHDSISAEWRAIVQLIAAISALWCLGGLAEIDVGIATLHLGWLGSVLGVITIVWLINLYNFMDGIDGLAGIQSVSAAGMGALLFAMKGYWGLSAACALLAAACAGFLVWNWSPAKIFMGDVGSYFLGYTFAVLAFLGESTAGLPALVWCILLGIFVWDATFTLLRRVFAGEAWYQPHRTHAYQRLVQLGFSHRQVAVGSLLANIFFLWPLAYASVVDPGLLVPIVLLTAAIAWTAWFLVQRAYRRHAEA
ncbi:MAG: MraY family glycosyltransferase [Gammaproteobacteria bacterium]